MRSWEWKGQKFLKNWLKTLGYILQTGTYSVKAHFVWVKENQIQDNWQLPIRKENIKRSQQKLRKINMIMEMGVAKYKLVLLLLLITDDFTSDWL